MPELNVQNGVLKALSFLFEYIGEMGKDYIYSVSPLLEDALIDRDLVHRQTAASVIQHMSLGVAGLGCEDGLTHLLNLVWPNIFEQSPHVVNAVMGAIDGCRLALGPPIIFNYTLQVTFVGTLLHMWLTCYGSSDSLARECRMVSSCCNLHCGRHAMHVCSAGAFRQSKRKHVHLRVQ